MSLKVFGLGLAIFGMLCIVFGFLLGQSKGAAFKKAIRNRIYAYWAWREETKWSGLAEADARNVLSKFESWFGKTPYGIRSFLPVSSISILITVSLLLLLSDYFFDTDEYLKTIVTRAYLVTLTIVNMFCDWFSYIVTFYILILLTKSASTSVIFLLIVLDIALIYVISSFAFGITLALVQPMMHFMGGMDFGLFVINTGNALRYFFENLLRQLGGLGATLLERSSESDPDDIVWQVAKNVLIVDVAAIIVITALLPSLLHLAILFVFSISKIVPQTLKKIINPILAAFYEAKEEPLTILGGAFFALGAFLMGVS